MLQSLRWISAAAALSLLIVSCHGQSASTEVPINLPPAELSLETVTDIPEDGSNHGDSGTQMRVPSSSGAEADLRLRAITDIDNSIHSPANATEEVNEFLGEPLGDLDTWEAPIEIQKLYPYYQAGFDDENRPIWVLEFGRWNVRRTVERGGEQLRILNKYIRQAAYRAVKSLEMRATPDEPVHDAVLICDADGISLHQVAHAPTISYLIHLSRKYTELISQHIHVGFVLNNNFVAETLINILRPIYGRVFEKVEIFGSNPSKYIPRLLRHIPEDQLPEWYGGRKTFRPVQIYG